MQGYGAQAELLAARYESLAFAAVHASVLDLFPPPPAHVLDIGAGSGRDAAHLADLGHAVTATEPSPEMRAAARRLHPEARIDWRDAALPALPGLTAPFDLVLLTAVWMHLDGPERAAALPRLAQLLAPGGRLILSIRHGPVPEGRRMFTVDPRETIDQAAAAGLRLLRHLDEASKQRANWLAGIHWTRLAFERPA
ncbi:class I SAM-dependent methyltransferase [Acidimangrovimonas pyrenivorans]|uniref:Class I SAM-dependent methyltransferase n=1 Tax=Acidimangrovimonas pyrenivorans TaxID=2030798 RepID=A0ABV7AL15_9RHOB